MTQALAADPAITATPPRHLPDRPPMLAVGVIIWLGSEVMFFSSLFAAFFTIRAHATVWPPPGAHLDTVRAGIFTDHPGGLELHHAEGRLGPGAGRAQERQALGLDHPGAGHRRSWPTSSSSGSSLSQDPATNPTQTAYGSLFYIMSGLHGLHVFLGLAAMLFLLARLRGPAGDPGETSVFQGVSYYWHFVDVVWVGLYSCLFLLK